MPPPSPPNPAQPSPRARWIGLVAKYGWLVPVALVLALWAFSIPYGFAFDDEHDILDTEAIHRLWPPDWAQCSRRPLVSATFALNWAWSGSQPWSYRLVNILIHAANAVLLWFCVRTALAEKRPPSPPPLRAPIVATVCATLWAVHPLHTSAVTYVVHRYETLAAGFMLATLLAWQRGAASRRFDGWMGIAVLSSVLAILSKEIAIVGPVLIAAYALAFGQLKPGSGAKRRWAWLAALCTAAYAVAAAVYPQSGTSVSQGTGTGISRWGYLWSEPRVLLHYLRLTVFPHPLSVDYYDWPVGGPWLHLLPAAVVVAFLVALTLWALLRSPRIGWTGLVAFAVLAPTSTIIPLAHELAAERRMYLPLAALCTLAVLGVERIGKSPRSLLALGAICVALLSARTVLRNLDFKTAESLFTHDLQTRPNNARLHRNLGAKLLKRGAKSEAWEHYLRTEALDPVLAPRGNMGALAAEFGLDDLAAKHFDLAIVRDPSDSLGWENGATFLLSIGRDAAARSVAERGEAANPKSAGLAEKLAWVLATARDPHVVDGPRAVREAQRAIALDGEAGASVSRGVTLAAAFAADGNSRDAFGLASMLLQQARAPGGQAWIPLLEPQVAAYARGERWIESGRRNWSQRPDASPGKAVGASR